MPIPFTCPHCGASTTVADKFAGQSGPCASCGKKIEIPSTIQAAPSKSPAAMVAVVAVVTFVAALACGGAGLLMSFRSVAVGRPVALRTSCSNNLKQIAIALHNYHDVYGEFPPAYTVDSLGRPLHSWRTLILPYLEHQALYDRIDLNKPWNDPVNMPIANTAVSVYCCPADPRGLTPGTHYLAVVGPDTIMQGRRSCRLADVLDGSSNTILVVEGSRRYWMEPRDLKVSNMRMLLGAGEHEIRSNHPGGAHIALADGSVQFIPVQITPDTLRAAITRSGGESVDLSQP